MSKRFASISEANAESYLATLGVLPCQTFALHFQTEFTDKHGTKFTGLPDYYHPESNTFIETKFCELATPQSFKTSETKMRAQYEWRFKRSSAGLKYHEVSTALWDAGWRKDCLNWAWNHCLTKHLLIQKALGRENYIVVFGNDLPEEVADKYTKKGLFLLHISQLEAYLTPA